MEIGLKNQKFGKSKVGIESHLFYYGTVLNV